MPSRERSAVKEVTVRRSSRVIGSLALGVVVLSSCSSGGEGSGPGVGVRSINTNIGLGVELEAAAPANIAPTVPPRRRSLEAPEATIPPFDFDVPKPTTMSCPAAGPFDFPERETGVVPNGRPPAGIYPWKIDGRVATGDGVFDIDDFETRTINNVEDHPSIPGAFVFAQTQRNFADYRNDRGTTTTIFRVVPTSPVDSEQVASDAGSGVFIEQIIFRGKDSEGRDVETTFRPVPAVQLIAFPVEDGSGNGGSTQTGAPIESSSGVDPETGAQLTIQGSVKGKKQIDACGDRVDSWFVDAVQTYRYPAGNGQTETIEANYDYGIAPQYGGMIVFEHVDAPRDGPVAQIDFRVGKVPGTAG